MQNLRTVPKLAKSHTPASSSLSQPLLGGCRCPSQHRIQISSANRICFWDWLPQDGNYCCSVTKKQNDLSESEVFFHRPVWSRPRHLSPFKICQSLSGRASFAKPVCWAMHRILPRSGCGYTLTSSLFTNHRGRSKTPESRLTNFISACWELFKVKHGFLGKLFFYFHKLFLKDIFKYFHFNQWEIYVK